MKKIAIFASGSGTNFQQICEYFQDNKDVEVNVLIVNKKNAYVRQRAANLGIEDHYFNRTDFYESEKVVELLKEKETEIKKSLEKMEKKKKKKEDLNQKC